MGRTRVDVERTSIPSLAPMPIHWRQLIIYLFFDVAKIVAVRPNAPG